MKARLVCWLCEALLACWTASLLAETNVENVTDEYVLRNWTVEDGLPQNSITAIAQDPDGYLWLATFNGLVRFDGVRFTIFDSGNTPALGANSVETFLMDHRGRLWVYTEGGGIACLERGVFTRCNGARGLPDAALDLGGERPDGRVVLNTPSGSYAEGVDGNFRILSAAGVETPDEEDTIRSDLRGSLFMKRGENWSKIPRDALLPLLRPGGLAVSRVQNSRSYGADGVILATDKALVIRERAKWVKKFDRPFELDVAMSLIEERSGTIWVATKRSGLWRMDPSGQFHRYLISRGAVVESLREVFEDREGSIWVGTESGGLYRLRRRTFQTVGASEGLRSEIVKSIAESQDGQIWVASSAGVDSFESSGKPHAARRADEALSWSTLCDSQGTVWLGTYGSSLYCWTAGAGAFSPQHPSGLNHIVALFEEPGRGLWAGTDDGLWRAGPQEVIREPLPTDATGTKVRSIVSDREGRLWVGLNAGGLLGRDSGGWRQYLLAGSPKASPVWALAADSAGQLWIGTPGAGLYRLKDGQFFHFDSERFGLPRFVASIIEDDLGSLWLGTTAGIYSVRRADLEAVADGRASSLVPVRYTQADGLGTSECSSAVQPVALKARDGRLWFATRKGVAVVDPKALAQNAAPPPNALIEEAVIWADTRRQVSIPSLNASNAPGALRIPPGSPLLEIHYTAPSFSGAERVRFRYRLDGADHDWVEAGSRRIAYYERLTPAPYRFRVMACNQEGAWSEAEAALNFIVEPHFWERWWFVGLVFASAAAVVGWVFRRIAVLRLERRLARLEREHAIERERQRIARDMHDDLGSDLARLALMTDAVAERSGEKGIVGELNGLAAFVRDVRQHASELVWLVNPKNDDLNEFASYLGDYSERVLATANLRFRWDAPLTFPNIVIPSDVRREVFMVVKETLNNLIRHSGASEVRFTLALAENRLSLEVADNGCGFDTTRVKARPGGGNGLRNMAQRLESLGGHLSIRSADGQGTVVLWSIPLVAEPVITRLGDSRRR